MVETEVDLESFTPTTLTEQVSRRLWDWILNGQLKPGDRLRIQDLAKKLKVSETPVREALARLRQSGIVQSVPWVGTRVKEFSRQDIVEAFDLRRALESFSVRQAARDVSREQLLHLKARLQDAEKALDNGDVGPAIAADMMLHDSIVSWARNSRISALLVNIRDQICMFVGFGALAAEGPREALEAHQRIVDLLLEHQEDAAANLMEAQLEIAKQQALTGYFGPGQGRIADDHRGA